MLVLLALIGIGQYSSANDFYLQGNVWSSGVKLEYKTTNTYLVRMDGLNAGWNYSFKVHETWNGGDTWWGKKSDWGNVDCGTENYGLTNEGGNVDLVFSCSEGGNYFFQYYIDSHKITIWKANPAGGFDNGNGKGVNASIYKNGEKSGYSVWKHDRGESGQGHSFGPVRTFFSITLPLLKPSILVALLFRTLDAFRVYDLIAVMTGGAQGTETLSIYAYKLMINQSNYGYGSIVVLAMAACVGIISFIFVKVLGAELLEDD